MDGQCTLGSAARGLGSAVGERADETGWLWPPGEQIFGARFFIVFKLEPWADGASEERPAKRGCQP